MDQLESNVDNPIGKRMNHDIYSESGVLLVSISTIITDAHLKVLERNDVALRSQDYMPIGQHDQLVNAMVLRVKQTFEEVRMTKVVPLADLRRDVIPMIQEAAGAKHLFSLIASFQSNDDYTYRHNVAVGVISCLIGTWMKLDHQELMQLTTAALLHDVGKMLISNDIINKPGELTSGEYAIMKNHTILGYGLMKETVGINHRQALVALQHHERMDGSGYPFGMSKEKIDIFSRIVSVADIFHAMTSKRIYHNPSPFYEVLSQMEKDTFTALDPAITRLFIDRIMNSIIGKSVLLTDGNEGTILMIQPHQPTRPLIQVGNKFIDLSKDLSVHIKQIL